MAPVFRVRQCELCRYVCDIMDTVCPRCRKYGTLRQRNQCARCSQLLDDDTCPACAASTGFRAGTPSLERLPSGELVEKPVPDLIDPYAVAPWLAGAVGGAVLGCVAGAIGAQFLGEEPFYGGLIGIIPGALLGVFMGGNTPANRR